MKQTITTVLIWILAFTVILTLVGAAYYTVEPWLIAESQLKNSSNPKILDQSNRWSLLPTLAICSGVLIAILTFARERQKLEIEIQRHKSKVFVERASIAFDSVIELLRNKTNSRVIWVRAARTLLTAVELGEHIRDPDYRKAYELETTRARNELYDALMVESIDSGERFPLPPQFFYGISDWDSTSKRLDEVAIEASAEINVYSMTIDEIPPHSSMKPLARRSVIAIYEFLEYPKDYEDPLDKVPNWDDNWSSTHGPDEGARRYVAHRNQYIAVGGELHERKVKDEPAS